MTTKTISGTIIANGYTLTGAYSLVSITSTGTIIGGTGAAGTVGPSGGIGGVGGSGGAAIWDVRGDAIYNSGLLQGGVGGVGGAGSGVGGVGGAGGFGGVGALFVGGGLINYSIITGGQGGQGGGPLGAGGRGAYGVVLVQGVLANHGTITGGQGGVGGSGGQFGGAGGSGADGVLLDSVGAVLTNTGVILGAAGGQGGHGSVASGAAGASGDGVRGYNCGQFSVVNGSVGSTAGTIAGSIGVFGPAPGSKPGSVTVTNFGTIIGTSGVSVEFLDSYDKLVAEAGSTFVGVVKASGGELDLDGPGSGTLTGLGATGLVTGPESMTVSGFGRYILGAGSSWTLSGMNNLADTAWVTVDGTANNTGHIYGGNYSATPGGAGSTPIIVSGGQLTNQFIVRGGSGVAGATLSGGSGGAGIDLASGSIVNEAGARIYGGQGGAPGSGSSATGGGGGAGIIMLFGGTLENYGLIQGGSGGRSSGFGGRGVFAGNGSLINLGTISAGAGAQSNGGLFDVGVSVAESASVTNGSSTTHGALIYGYLGVYDLGSGPSTVTNFGTIQGSGRYSVILESSSTWLAAEAGSDFIGAVSGGGGGLELGAATGTITGLGATGTVSGSIAMTFSKFGSYDLDAGGSWTIRGANNLGAAQELALIGSASLVGGLNTSGTLILGGVLTGTGTLTNAGGVTTVDNRATIGVAAWVNSGGTISINESLGFAGAFREAAAGTVLLGASDKLSLSGPASLYGLVTGPNTGAAALDVVNATVSGLVIGGTLSFVASGTVTQAGIVTVGDASAASAILSILKGGVWNIGTGGIGRGASTGSNIFNGGALIKNTGTTASVVSVAMTNNGLVEVSSGALDLTQLVHGTGRLQVDAGATLETAATTSTLSAIFNGPGATLALAQPKKFAATISGFAATDAIDLIRTKATGASINGSDQLVIVNGATTVTTFQLSGSYSGATFSVASDGKGGTDVSLLTAISVLPSSVPMVSAMAAMAPMNAGPVSHIDAAQPQTATLARPGG